MEDIVIKLIDNGFIVTQGKKSYVAKSPYGLTDIILKLVKESSQDTPPPISAIAKKVALNEG